MLHSAHVRQRLNQTIEDTPERGSQPAHWKLMSPQSSVSSIPTIEVSAPSSPRHHHPHSTATTSNVSPKFNLAPHPANTLGLASPFHLSSGNSSSNNSSNLSPTRGSPMRRLAKESPRPLPDQSVFEESGSWREKEHDSHNSSFRRPPSPPVKSPPHSRLFSRKKRDKTLSVSPTPRKLLLSDDEADPFAAFEDDDGALDPKAVRRWSRDQSDFMNTSNVSTVSAHSAGHGSSLNSSLNTSADLGSKAFPLSLSHDDDGAILDTPVFRACDISFGTFPSAGNTSAPLSAAAGPLPSIAAKKPPRPGHHNHHNNQHHSNHHHSNHHSSHNPNQVMAADASVVDEIRRMRGQQREKTAHVAPIDTSAAAPAPAAESSLITPRIEAIQYHNRLNRSNSFAQVLAHGGLPSPVLNARAALAAQAPRPGEEGGILETEFINLGDLGEGSFGHVYRCQSRKDGKEYAIKVSKKAFRGTRDRQAMVKEVKNFKVLGTHDHVVTIDAAWTENNRLFIQTELCERGSLASYIAHQDVITEEEIWSWTVDIALGLQHIHDHHLVHMDIKPANIFLSSTGALKIGDLGIAVQEGRWEDGLEGDASYLAPELLSGETVDHNADIFSFGCSLFEIAANVQLPRMGELWQRLRRGEIDFPEHPRRSEELMDLIRWMMHPNPLRRPSCAQILQTPRCAEILARRKAMSPKPGRSLANAVWTQAVNAAKDFIVSPLRNAAASAVSATKKKSKRHGSSSSSAIDDQPNPLRRQDSDITSVSADSDESPLLSALPTRKNLLDDFEMASNMNLNNSTISSTHSSMSSGGITSPAGDSSLLLSSSASASLSQQQQQQRGIGLFSHQQVQTSPAHVSSLSLLAGPLSSSSSSSTAQSASAVAAAISAATQTQTQTVATVTAPTSMFHAQPHLHHHHARAPFSLSATHPPRGAAGSHHPSNASSNSNVPTTTTTTTTSSSSSRNQPASAAASAAFRQRSLPRSMLSGPRLPDNMAKSRPAPPSPPNRVRTTLRSAPAVQVSSTLAWLMSCVSVFLSTQWTAVSNARPRSLLNALVAFNVSLVLVFMLTPLAAVLLPLWFLGVMVLLPLHRTASTHPETGNLVFVTRLLSLILMLCFTANLGAPHILGLGLVALLSLETFVLQHAASS